MANPQVEDGFTRIANELIDKGFTQINLSAYETRTLWVLLRSTYGWQKEEDPISVSQYMEKTGIKRRHVQRTLNRMVSRNIFFKKDGYINTYGLQKDYEKWDISQPAKQVKSTSPGTGLKTSTFSGAGVAPKEVHTKEKRNITKDIVSKEGLATFLHTLNDLSLKVQEIMLDFLDRVRQGNSTKHIAPSRVERIVQELRSISNSYGGGIWFKQ